MLFFAIFFAFFRISLEPVLHFDSTSHVKVWLVLFKFFYVRGLLCAFSLGKKNIFLLNPLCTSTKVCLCRDPRVVSRSSAERLNARGSPYRVLDNLFIIPPMIPPMRGVKPPGGGFAYGVVFLSTLLVGTIFRNFSHFFALFSHFLGFLRHHGLFYRSFSIFH